MNKNAYEVLNLSTMATDEEIKRQYHTLMRNLHSNSVIGIDLTEEEEEETLRRVKEYNEAFSNLTNGNREKYDASLTDTYDIKKDTSAYQKVKSTILSSKMIGILKKYTYFGSLVTDSIQKIRQEYLRLQSQKRKIEKVLEQEEQSARIEFLNKAPTNAIQLGIDAKQKDSEIVSLEFKRDAELARIQEHYVFQASKRMITPKKRDMLKKQAEIEVTKVNERYDYLIEAERKKKEALNQSLNTAKKAEQDAISANPNVQKVRTLLASIRNELTSLEGKLGTTSSYTKK